MFNTHASDSSVRYGVTVRLDAGGIAPAGNAIGVMTPVGSRVELSETTGLLTGIRRYRLYKLIEGPKKKNAPSESVLEWRTSGG